MGKRVVRGPQKEFATGGRNPQFSLRLQPQQLKRIEQAASRRGFEVHEWARMTLLNAAHEEDLL